MEKEPISNQDGERVLDQEEYRKLAKELLLQAQQELPNEIKSEAKTAKKIQDQFIAVMERNADEGKRMSDEDLLAWEEDYAHSWDKIEEKIVQCGLEDNPEEQANLEYALFDKSYGNLTEPEQSALLRKTIEAQVGRFFVHRATELRKAIEASDSEDKEKELELFAKFTKLVEAHIDHKVQANERKKNDEETAKETEANRIKCHNELIRTLNALNKLCEKYGKTRFTPRDFWTTDSGISQSLVAPRMRLRIDRDAVEEYYAVAFQGKAKEAWYKLIDNNPQMLLDEKTKRDYFLRRDHFNGFWDDEQDESA